MFNPEVLSAVIQIWLIQFYKYFNEYVLIAADRSIHKNIYKSPKLITVSELYFPFPCAIQVSLLVISRYDSLCNKFVRFYQIIVL